VRINQLFWDLALLDCYNACFIVHWSAGLGVDMAPRVHSACRLFERPATRNSRLFEVDSSRYQLGQCHQLQDEKNCLAQVLGEIIVHRVFALAWASSPGANGERHRQTARKSGHGSAYRVFYISKIGRVSQPWQGTTKTAYSFCLGTSRACILSSQRLLTRRRPQIQDGSNDL